jgi:phosphoribosylformylglycinamidine cyclo-ligase
MELYLPEAYADAVIAVAESFGIAGQVVGRVEDAPAKKLTIKSPFGTFSY